MAHAVNVAGPAEVKVGTGSAGALESLGYTRQGADVRNQGFFIDVPGDQNGGDQGPPIEVQYLGEIARIRLEMTKWDEAIAAKIRTRLLAGTEGTPGAAGTLMFGDSKTVRVTLSTTTGPMNFPRCFIRGEWEINKGTRYSTLVVEFEAHKDSTGVLYNAVVT
jgi:hypothetical protein